MTEAALLAGVSRSTLRRRIRHGKLPVVRMVENDQVVQAIPLTALRKLYPAEGAGAPAGEADPGELERLRARSASLAATLSERDRELQRVRAERDTALGEVRRLAHELSAEREPAVEALAGRVQNDLSEARQLLAEAGAVLLALRERDEQVA